MSSVHLSGRITILLDAQGRALTKGYVRRFGKVTKSSYPNAVEFRALVFDAGDITSLAELLNAVADQGIAAVIRGKPGKFYPRNDTPAYRLLHPQEGLVAARTGQRLSNYTIRKNNLEPDQDNRWAVTWLPTFEDCPRSWVIFDVDRIPVPEHMASDWVDDPDAAVEHVLGLLPEPFQTATCWWSLSSSAAEPSPTGRAVPDLFKLKLAFWLDRPLTGPQIKRWMAAEKAPVDPALFGAVQLIYIARPSFGEGLHDPVSRRTGIWQGEVDTVGVPEILPEPEVHSYASSGAAGFAPAEGLEELCAQLRERLQGELHVRAHLLQAAFAYFHEHGADVEQKPIVEALEGVAKEFRNEGEVAGYGVDRLVDYAAQQTRRGSWTPFGRPSRPGKLPPYFGLEGANRFALVNDQKRALRSWISRQHRYALARREIAKRRAKAFEEAGLA